MAQQDPRWSEAIANEIAKLEQRLLTYQGYLDKELENLDDIERGSLIKYVQSLHDRLEALQELREQGPPQAETTNDMSNGTGYSAQLDRMNNKLDDLTAKVGELDLQQRLMAREIESITADVASIRTRLKASDPVLSRSTLLVGAIALVVMFSMLVWILWTVSV